MIWQNINYEELHDSVIGDCYDFKYLCIKQFNRLNIEVLQKGKLQVDTITTNVIGLNIILDKHKIVKVSVFKDIDFIMTIAY